MVVLPFLNAFRNVAFANVSLGKALANTFKNLPTAWLDGDYDAYTMFTLVVDYVSHIGVTAGNQLLGAIFFFVPRSIWPGKAVGSGYHVADTLGWSFKNLSCPLPGEGYINFGIIGIILFGVFIGRLTMKLDVLYWKSIDIKQKNIRRIDVIYPVTAMFFFFMCRGDLMSSFAYMVGYIAVWEICIQIMRFSVKKIKKR